MTVNELKRAFLDERPVAFGGITYQKITAVIYRKTPDGKGPVSYTHLDVYKRQVEAITPVPGGVGTVTTSVLVKHVVEAAEKASK